MIAAVSWAAGSVYQKSHPIDADRVTMTGYQLLLASAISAVGFAVSGETLPTHLSPRVAGAIAYHVIGATAMAYWLWFTLLNRVAVGSGGFAHHLRHSGVVGGDRRDGAGRRTAEPCRLCRLRRGHCRRAIAMWAAGRSRADPLSERPEPQAMPSACR